MPRHVLEEGSTKKQAELYHMLHSAVMLDFFVVQADSIRQSESSQRMKNKLHKKSRDDAVFLIMAMQAGC